METLIKAFKCDYKYPIAILRFLAELKTACILNSVFKGRAMSIKPTFVKKGPPFILTDQMNFCKDDGNIQRLPKTCKLQTFTYMKAEKFSLKWYATDSRNAKTTLVIVCMKKASKEASLQLADILRSKDVRSENAYPKKRTRRVFIDGLPVNTQSAVRMFWGRAQNFHLLLTVQ